MLSAPNAHLNGIQFKKTNKIGLCGRGCRIDGQFIGTIWPALNSGMFMTGFVVSSTAMVWLYALIRFKTSRLRCFNKLTTPTTTLADNSSDPLLDGNSASAMGNSFVSTTGCDVVVTGCDVVAWPTLTLGFPLLLDVLQVCNRWFVVAGILLSILRRGMCSVDYV